MTHTALVAAESVGLSKKNVLVLQSYPELKLESADASVTCDFEKGGILSWKKLTDQKELEQSKICVLYSSGTTGLPKGLLTHIAGLQGYFINPFYDGGKVFWMPTFNFDDFLQYCGKFSITFLFTVPPIYKAIANHPAVKDQFCHIQNAVSGAAPLTKKLQEAATGKMKMACLVTQAWGLSETTAGATYVAPGAQYTAGSVGRLLPNVTMRLVDDNGRDELIKYKGLQVAPAELEAQLMEHPAVADAAVIGVDQSGTEVPRAYIVLASKFRGSITGAGLAEYVKSRVSDYKHLRGGVEFVNEIPRNAAGKIMRKVLKDWREKDMHLAKL
ncbi:hypothetical protein Neosp_006828 [[Neocosmospora] mangrovei]